FTIRIRRPPRPPLFPYTTLFRSTPRRQCLNPPPAPEGAIGEPLTQGCMQPPLRFTNHTLADPSPILRLTQSKAAMQIRLLGRVRSEEHTSELQSRGHLVCRLLLE